MSSSLRNNRLLSLLAVLLLAGGNSSAPAQAPASNQALDEPLKEEFDAPPVDSIPAGFAEKKGDDPAPGEPAVANPRPAPSLLLKKNLERGDPPPDEPAESEALEEPLLVPPLPKSEPGSQRVQKKDASADATAPLTSQAQRITGQLFRVSGVSAVKYARAAGFKFSPMGATGACDGQHTQFAQIPNVVTSEVNDNIMTQFQPGGTGNRQQISNRFFMFANAQGQPTPLADGWMIRGIRLNGQNWKWSARPQSGARTASFSVDITAFKDSADASKVELVSITLEGPKGSTDWRAAFPHLAPTQRSAGETSSR